MSVKSWLILSLTPGLGTSNLQQLLEQFGSAAGILAASQNELRGLGVNDKLCRALSDPGPDQRDQLAACERWLEQPAHHFLHWDDPRWPELLHPFASAIDTELPVPPERTHLMVGSKAGWVDVAAGAADRVFDEYPEESIADWHQRLNLER